MSASDQIERNKEEQLRKLNLSSFEAKVIFKNFADRKRVHTDSLIVIKTFYNSFIKQKMPVKLGKFAEVFLELEKLGYGVTEREPNGEIKAFLPDINIKYLGTVAQPILTHAAAVQVPVIRPQIIKPIEGPQVVTLEFEGGKLKKAHVPANLVDTVNRLINN